MYSQNSIHTRDKSRAYRPAPVDTVFPASCQARASNDQNYGGFHF